MVKINQQAGSLRIARERNALALLRDASALRVPEYIGDGDDWIVMSRLPGDVPGDASHPPEQISPELGAQLGALTAQLHNGPRPPGFGTWTDRDYSLRDEYEVRVTALHGLGVDYKIVERSELDAVRDLLLARVDVVDSAPREPVLAHRDVQPRNVLVDPSGRLTALLDFESSGGGDPAEDFKCIGLDWDRPGFAAFARGYRDGGGAVDEAFAERAALYVAHWALAAFAYLGSFAPWFLPVARAAVRRVEQGEVPRV